MLRFMVDIESADGTAIRLGGPDADGVLSADVTDVEVLLDTHDDQVTEKASGMLARVTVKGAIAKDDNPELLKVFAWAKDFDEDTTYRKVKITVYSDDKGKVFRTYEFEEMFVRDYEESYVVTEKSDDNKGNVKETRAFALYMTQIKNKLDKVKSY